jgi:hypothetical protein
MKKSSIIVLSCLFILGLTSFNPDKGWISLMDKKMSKWTIYQSYRLKFPYKGEVPKDANGKTLPPIGYDKNEANVFSVQMQNNEPVLHISGEIYGCIYTKQEFQNYHLKLKTKFGTKKWEPRLNEPMDSGLLYHSQGECGADYFHSWMLSEEFQVMEGGIGDYWNVGTAHATVRASKPTGVPNYVFNKDAYRVFMGVGAPNQGFCQRHENFENPKDEWNTMELICYGDRSVYIVNGHVVNALSNLSYQDGKESKPLTKGKLQLQSEAGEVYFKDIQIKSIDKMPEEYAAFF